MSVLTASILAPVRNDSARPTAAQVDDVRMRRSTRSSFGNNEESGTHHDPSQAWFWTETWQASVRRSLDQIQAGEGVRFDTDEGFLEVLGDE